MDVKRDLLQVFENQVAGFCQYDNEHSSSIRGTEFVTSWETIRSSRRTLLHGVSYGVIIWSEEKVFCIKHDPM
jgi:hypothetical protein